MPRRPIPEDEPLEGGLTLDEALALDVERLGVEDRGKVAQEAERAGTSLVAAYLALVASGRIVLS